MINEVYGHVKYFLVLNLQSEVFWSVFPLVLCTILILSYFARYKDERAGWNTYFSNSLVLVFVSLNLFRYIYGLNGVGASNYLDYPAKSIAVLLLVIVGSLFMKFNFSHLLPERYARVISSPLSINLIAYAVILYVYSSLGYSWAIFISLLLFVFLLGLVFEILKFPLRLFSDLMEKELERDRFRDIKEAKFEIDELKRTLKSREKEIKEINLRQLEKERRTAIKLEKLIK